MAIAYSDIARVLDGARRRQARFVLVAALASGLAAALLALLGGVLLLGWGVLGASAVRQVALAGAGLAVASALAWAAQALLRRAASQRAVAQSVGKAAPELKSDLLSAVELEESYDELTRSGCFSVALIDAHIDRTATRMRALDLERVISARPVVRAGLFLLVVMVMHAAAWALAPRLLRGGWQRLVGTAPDVTPRVEPITGDIEITYAYPAYMRRESRTISGTGGEVSAPRGTEVKIVTRSDRVVEQAEMILERASAPPMPMAAPTAAGARQAPAAQAFAMEVAKGGRDLTGRFTVDVNGSYRFRFVKGKKVVALGPALPIAVEPDAFPEARITAPAEQVEVDARARIHVEWSASDDVGLAQIVLVTKPPEGEEKRQVLRTPDATRREAGSYDLDLGAYRLAEGEKLLYWIEATDGDVVSGPKRAASTTHVVKVYSEAEHHREALARARVLWEDLVRLLGDRLELFEGGPRWTPERLGQARGFDARTKVLHEGLRTAAQELGRDRTAPRGLSQALANVAAALRPIEQGLTPLRDALSRLDRTDSSEAALIATRLADRDAQLDSELEKDALYLEQLFDKQRADDLVRLARDLASRRRDLAGLLENYKKAPTEEGRKELQAEVSRMRTRMQEMLLRMGELAKGLNDEHMNKEALAELMKSRDAMGSLDSMEKLLEHGDVEAAMKALDRLGSTMQEMLTALERTAGRPGQQNSGLMKEMLAFKKLLEDVERSQAGLARETEHVKGEYQKQIAQRLQQVGDRVKKLELLAAEARKEVAGAEPGVGLRSEDDFAQSRDRLADLQRALQAKDLDAALDTVRRALPPMQRLAIGLGDDATAAERYGAIQGGGKAASPGDLREAQRHAAAAVGPARRVKDELEKLFPEPKSVLNAQDQQKLGELAQRQGELEHKAGELRQKLSDFAKRVPIFPPSATQALGGTQGHMLRAQSELSRRNPQRGHSEQQQAIDDLARFRRGMEELAKNGGGAGGFPLPFGEQRGGQGGGEGEGGDLQASQEKVEIPGADAYKVPDAFRRDLLDAMKQGAPEAYKGEVQRYYQELIK